MIIQNQSLVEALEENKDMLLVTSARYLKQLPYNIDQNKLILVNFANITETDLILDLIKKYQPKNLIGYGSGKVIDISKYSSFVSNTKFIAIPSCLSTNCYFTDKSTLFIDNIKNTLPSKIPEKVIFDWDIIRKNQFMNRCGNIELLSSLTALVDWQIAQDNHQENINIKIYRQAFKIAIKASEMFFSKKNKIKTQSKLLHQSGSIAVSYGSGRPVSGSEHILASIIENHYHCPHGLALSISIPLVLRFQEKLDYKQIIPNFDQIFIKTFPFKNYIRDNMDKKTIYNLLSGVNPRKDRYSVIDKIKNKDFLKILGQTVDDLFS